MIGVADGDLNISISDLPVPVGQAFFQFTPLSSSIFAKFPVWKARRSYKLSDV